LNLFSNRHKPLKLNIDSGFSLSHGRAELSDSERGRRAAGRVGLQHFTASDGARIAFEQEGEGRPLLLLHGLMAHSGFFEKQRELAQGFRLIRPDLRGHGASRAAAGGGDAELSIERLAQDVAELAAHLGLNDAVAVGWSLGASVLFRLLAGPASDRFAGAVIVDMTPRVLNEGDWTLGLSGEVCGARLQAIREDFEGFAASAGAAIFAQPLRDGSRALAEWAGAEFARNDPAAVAALWSSLVGSDFRPLLARIRQPTLVVHGAHSHLYGADTADYLVAALPDATAIPFAESGHAPHLEQAELFNRTLRDFAASLPRVRESQTMA
jgi:pimeloyl-ACP methyl ester carboxylesterase